MILELNKRDGAPVMVGAEHIVAVHPEGKDGCYIETVNNPVSVTESYAQIREMLGMPDAEELKSVRTALGISFQSAQNILQYGRHLIRSISDDD